MQLFLKKRRAFFFIGMGTDLQKNNRNNAAILAVLTAGVIMLFFVSLLCGVSGMTVKESFAALMRRGTAAQQRIIWNIRIPRILAAVIAGAGLSVSGLLMQTNLNNALASPSTLGVSNAAVFGANLSIILGAGGFLSTGNNLSGYLAGINPYATSLIAFLFSTASILLILGLCRMKSFAPGVVILAGVAMGSVWTAATTVLQFYATDVGLSAAVIWTFGDLGRATYRTDLIMVITVAIGIAFAVLMRWRLNALLSGDAAAKSMGLNVNALRFASLLLASLMTAVCVSFLGVIGFVGMICPHVVKRVMGQDHRITVPASALSGSILLLLADTLSRTIGKGAALPVGAITSILGAPFFLAIILFRKERSGDA